MHLFAIIANLRFQDVLDILFLTVMVYYLYRWFKGTKAFKALVGLVALGIVYTVSDAWGLFLTTWVFCGPPGQLFGLRLKDRCRRHLSLYVPRRWFQAEK